MTDEDGLLVDCGARGAATGQIWQHLDYSRWLLGYVFLFLLLNGTAR